MVNNHNDNYEYIKNTESCLQNLKNMCTNDSASLFLHKFISNVNKYFFIYYCYYNKFIICDKFYKNIINNINLINSPF
jgi:hypothetical protein